MGFLADAMNVPDPIVLRNGQEAQFKVQKAALVATSGKDSEGNPKPVRPMINIMLTCISEAGITPLFFRMIGDLPEDSPESTDIRAQERKAFARAFGIDPATDGDAPMEQFAVGMEEVRIPGWEGKTGWLVTGIEVYNGQEKNTVARFVIPK